MKILLDECIPRKLKYVFLGAGHTCETVTEAGFSGKKNGELLALVDREFDVLVTVDKNFRHQQNLNVRNIALLVIRANSNEIDEISVHMDAALAALRSISPGSVVEVGSE
jgi:predicted nuclease of predicted toxin-antitoxin system